MHPSSGQLKTLPLFCPLTAHSAPPLRGHHHHPCLGTHPLSWTRVVFYLSPSLAALPASGRPCSPLRAPRHCRHRRKVTDLSYMGASQVAPLVKNPPANAGDTGDMGLIPGLERSPGGGNGNPLQQSCLENPMDRGAWWATVHGVTKSQSWLSNWAHTHTHNVQTMTGSWIKKINRY